MGYYSKVCIVAEKNVGSELEFLFLQYGWFEHDFCKIKKGKNRIAFEIPEVKWYSSYDEIVGIVQVLNRALLEHEDEAGWCFQLVRVGEDFGDIEVLSNGDICELWAVASIQRSEYWDEVS